DKLRGLAEVLVKVNWHTNRGRRGHYPADAHAPAHAHAAAGRKSCELRMRVHVEPTDGFGRGHFFGSVGGLTLLDQPYAGQVAATKHQKADRERPHGAAA